MQQIRGELNKLLYLTNTLFSIHSQEVPQIVCVAYKGRKYTFALLARGILMPLLIVII